ncbi:MAG: FliA/WhiG family RNA polymerase sigma factor [Oscillospiraceae bacterium]
MKTTMINTVHKQCDPEQLMELYQKTRDVELRNKLVMYYSSIAKTVAFQMRGIFGDYAQMEDIVNQGVIALIDCVERFDIEKQVKFQTYAYLRVRGAVIDFVRKQDWIPRRIRVASKNINHAHDELCNELLREPTNIEIARKMDISLEALNKYYSEISGAVTLSFEGSIQGLNYVESSLDEYVGSQDSADAGLYQKELKDIIKQSIASLTEREQQVVSLYYYEELKQAEIARILQVSEQRVSQIISKAIQKIKFTVGKYMKEG